MEPKQNIINCHTHIFKSDAIPPFLAKTFLSWPFYYIFNTSVILGLARFWYNNKLSPRRWPYISYILHDLSIIPLLKTSLQNPKLSERILFGTDFYVVRNHKSEREKVGEMQSSLSDAEFDLIARMNPVSYLTSSNYP